MNTANRLCYSHKRILSRRALHARCALGVCIGTRRHDAKFTARNMAATCDEKYYVMCSFVAAIFPDTHPTLILICTSVMLRCTSLDAIDYKFPFRQTWPILQYLKACLKSSYYHPQTSLALNVTVILWLSVPHTLATLYNTVLADVNLLNKTSHITRYAICFEVQWSEFQQIQTLSGQISVSGKNYPVLLCRVLWNNNA